jgi:hypothetical protein
MELRRYCRSGDQGADMATVMDLAGLAGDCYKDNSTNCGQWIRIQDTPPLGGITGFFGAAYAGGDGGRELVIAFRGSEGPGADFIRDWVVNDVAIASSCIPIIQVGEAELFARSLVGLVSARKYYVVGHSLGGALAQIVAGNLAGTIGLSFNAPGVMGHVWALSRRWINAAANWNIRADGDPVSKVGEHVGHEPITIGSSGISSMLAEALTVYQGINSGLFVGLASGVPQLALVTAAVGGAGAVVGIAKKSIAAHQIGAIMAGLKDNPIANLRPEELTP